MMNFEISVNGCRGMGGRQNAQLGGSFVSENIEDYYVTPWDLGYGHILKFDHDFIGREALESLSAEQRRQKVTPVWNRDDVAAIFASALGQGPRYKAIDLPVASITAGPSSTRSVARMGPWSGTRVIAAIATTKVRCCRLRCLMREVRHREPRLH
ncbi:hypothetical protein ACOJBO_00215 [Rhizobium beringeri]